MNATKTGYINGSDMLFSFKGKAFGHCSSHTTTYTAETKERAVKPLASVTTQAGLWTNKGVVKLSVTVKGDGLRVYDEVESGFKTGLGAWAKGKSVEVKAFERGEDETPYMSGNFIVTNIEETSPASDDATYSIMLENDGPVVIDESKLSGETVANE